MGQSAKSRNAPGRIGSLASKNARASARRSRRLQQFTGSMDSLPQILESGAFARQYRDHRLEWMIRSGGVEVVLAGLKKKTIRFSSEVS